MPSTKLKTTNTMKFNLNLHSSVNAIPDNWISMGLVHRIIHFIDPILLPPQCLAHAVKGAP